MEITDDLLINFLLGEATPEDIKQIEQWRTHDPANQQRLNQFKLIWEKSKNLEFKDEIDAHASLERLKQKISLQKHEAPQIPVTALKVSRLNRSSWIKIAAAIVLVVAGAWFYTARISREEVQFFTQEAVKADTLSDGSVVTLNKNSLLKYPRAFQSGQRQVWLTKGEAFFSVTPDKTKPFLIHTGTTTIKVVGTSFNVKNRNGSVEVIVETGLVMVSKNGNTVSLRPGEKVVVKTGNEELVKIHNPDYLYNYYRSKEFVADDTPLWRMVEVLNEAYDSRVVIGRKELNNLPLNTTFKNESLDNILEVISRTFKIKIERKHSQIILY